ncbi:MAG TPA: thioredoxin domain-containing protein [Myxococcales bacterium]|nr:thioredoxin domain-containing protein [Myxococcales bacterium]
MPRTLLAPLLLAALASSGACHGNGAAKTAPPPPTTPAAPATADCTNDYPNLPLSELPEPARLQFCRFAQDTLCYCGCPHMLAGCLKNHPSCPHASRMAAIALAEIANGATAEKAGEAVAAYYDSFKASSRVKFDPANLPCMGAADAPLTLVEFSDFDCPHCKAARPLLEGLVKDRTDVRLCFMSFPLHPHSGIAAAAAYYAYGKGEFWKLHDLQFENQDARATLDEASYTAEIERLGAEAGLDKAGLDKAIHDPALMDMLLKQKEAASQKLGVDGTPFVFLNGRALPLFSPEMLKLTLGDEQEWIANGNAWAKD